MNNLKRQKGVLIFLMPFLFVVIALAAALAMDVVRIYSIKSDMQSVVNAAATAGADEVQTCGVGDLALIEQRGKAAAKALGYRDDLGELEVFAGVMSPNSDGVITEFTTVGQDNIAQSNAAAARYTQLVPAISLFPDLMPRIPITVNAASRKELYASMSVSGGAAKVEGGVVGALLGALLGDPSFSLKPTDIRDLQNTLLGVGDLLAALGVSDLTAFAQEPLIDLLDGILGLTQVATSPVADVVNALTSISGIEDLKVGDVLVLEGDHEIASAGEFPLYDFVISVVMNSVEGLTDSGLLSLKLDTSNESGGLLSGLTNVTAPLLGEIDVFADLHVGEAAPIVVGPARMKNGEWVTKIRTSDISLAVLAELKLDPLGAISLIEGLLKLVTGITTGGFVEVKLLDEIRLPIVVQAGVASAKFVGGRCARPVQGDFGANDVDVKIQAKSSLLEVNTGTLTADGAWVNKEPIHASILDVLVYDKPWWIKDRSVTDVVGLCLSADLNSEVTSGDYDANELEVQSYELYCPDGDCEKGFDTTGVKGTDELNLSLKNVRLLCGTDDGLGDYDVLGKIVEALLTPITELLNEVVSLLLKGLINPVLDLLGVHLGAMNATVVGADQLSHQLIENVEIHGVAKE